MRSYQIEEEPSTTSLPCLFFLPVLFSSFLQNDVADISPSTIFAVASILEGVSYINGSPQNTFVPGVMELAAHKDVFIAGDDFKSGALYEVYKNFLYLSLFTYPYLPYTLFFVAHQVRQK